MNNICVDMHRCRVTVEGHDTPDNGPYEIGDCEPDSIARLISKVLDALSYGGETVCLEIRGDDGKYREIDRWVSLT